MNAIQKAVRRGRRRLLWSRMLITAGWWLLISLGIAAVLFALVDTSLVAAMPWWVYPSLAGAAVLASIVFAYFRGRPTDLTVAVLIDDRLHLKDQLSTSLWAASIKDDPFAQHVLEQAERTAGAIDAHQALKTQVGNGWKWALPGWAVLALLLVFLPVFDPFGAGQHRQDRIAEAERQEAAREHIMEASSLVRNIEPPKGELSEADPQDAMRDLAEMTRRDLRNPEMKRELEAKLSQAQQQLAEQQALAEQQVRTLRNQMSALDTGQTGPADRFADALRRGDFEQAQKELAQMIDKLENGNYSEQEKQQLKEQLQNMSESLQQMAQNAAAQQQQAQQQINQQLQQAGLSQQQIQQLQQNGYNQQQMQQALQQSGMSQQQAQQMAQQMSQQAQQSQSQSQSQNQTSSQCQGLGTSLGTLASSIGQQGQGQGQQQGAGQAGYSAQQQIAQMAQMQQQMQQMQQAQQQMSSALHNLNSQQGQGQGQGPGQGPGSNNAGSGNQPSQKGGTGGRKAGTGDGGAELGVEKNLSGQYQAAYEGDIKQREGRVIASWQTYGEVAAGEATVQYNTAVTEARSDAERAVADDRVPRRYHGAIKEYFNQLPATPDKVRQAPAAPR